MDNNELLKQTKEALDKAVDEAKRNRRFLDSVGPAILDMLRPTLDKIAGNVQKNTQEIRDAVSKIKVEINPEVRVPDIHVPEIKIPEIKVPKPEVTVRVAAPKIPPIKFSDVKFPEYPKPKEYDWKNPLPVILTDIEGRPYSAGWIGGSGGGNTFSNLSFLNNVPIDSNNGPAGYGTLRVTVATDANVSVSLTGSTGSIAAALIDSSGVQYSGSNALPVSIGAANVNQWNGNTVSVNDGEVGVGTLRIVHAADIGASVSIIGNIATLDVKQMSGDISSTNLLQVGGNAVVVGTGYQDNALRVVNATDAVTSVSIAGNVNTLDVKQMSGDVSSVSIVSNIATLDVKQMSGDVSSTVINSIVSPIGQGDTASALRVVHAGDSGASVSIIGNINTLDVKQMSGDVSSTVINSIVSPIGQGDTASALRIVHAGDSGTSVFITGSADSMMVLMARTTNPTAVSDGADVRATGDKLGRALSTPVQVRQLRNTAYVALTTGTETLLLASAASTFNDLIYITAGNSSTAAVQLDIRSETAAGIMATLAVPASGTTGVAFPVPLPQNTAAGTWTVKMPDITGTTVWISALFSQEL